MFPYFEVHRHSWKCLLKPCSGQQLLLWIMAATFRENQLSSVYLQNQEVFTNERSALLPPCPSPQVGLVGKQRVTAGIGLWGKRGQISIYISMLIWLSNSLLWPSTWKGRCLSSLKFQVVSSPQWLGSNSFFVCCQRCALTESWMPNSFRIPFGYFYWPRSGNFQCM